MNKKFVDRITTLIANAIGVFFNAVLMLVFVYVIAVFARLVIMSFRAGWGAM